MKNDSKLLMCIMALALFIGGPKESKALTTSALTCLGTTAVIIVAMVLASGNESVKDSTKRDNRFIIESLQEDAAAYIASEGEQEPSTLLKSAIANTRAGYDAVRTTPEEVTNLEVARALLNAI